MLQYRSFIVLFYIKIKLKDYFKVKSDCRIVGNFNEMNKIMQVGTKSKCSFICIYKL